MRLACPNCDARYEVPDDAIPAGGRDVQCSNCGHGWFQLRPEEELALEEEAALYGDDLPTPEPLPPAAPSVASHAGVAPAVTPSRPVAPPPLPEDEEEDEATPPAFAAVPPPAATAALEDSVLSVLREEAEREAEARRSETQRQSSRQAEAERQMQVQPDLGIEPAAPAVSATRRRLAMLKGEDPDAPPPSPPRPAARRDLLPDVEEINSTLQPGDRKSDPDAEVEALPDLTRGHSFRTGFLLAVFLLFVAAVVYVTADSIGALVPALKAPLDSYVLFVDGLRLWLNATMDNATNAISPPPASGN